jgi:transcription elongation factor/antiterminator RfaH
MMFWSVVQTETQRENVAAHFLQQGGFETYLPKIKAQQRIVPLFPAYLFVRVIDHWYDINNTIGVVQLLHAGDQPAKLKDKIVDSIKSRERGGIVKLPDPNRLRPGQQVRIKRGSFEGHCGIYQGMSGKQRERVLLELLGRSVPVDVATADVDPLQLASRS